MNLGPLLTEVFVTFFAAVFLLYRYGDWYRHHLIVTISVLIAWHFSFLIAFILPLDVTSTVYRQCLDFNSTNHSAHSNGTWLENANFSLSDEAECQEPWSFVPDRVFSTLWRVVYWTSQFLTWLVLPLMQSYTRAGDFTPKGKLKSALKANAIYYGSYLVIASALLIYLLTRADLHLNGPKLKIIASSASNTWGLFWLVLLLGYGLVDVPRSLFKASNRGYQLRYQYFKAAKLCAERMEAEENLEDVIESIRGASKSIPVNHPLRPYVETVEKKIPLEFQEKIKRRNRVVDANDSPNEGSLVNLHKQVIKAVQVYHRTETQWFTLIERITDLEDIAKNEVSSDRVFRTTNLQQRGRLWAMLHCPKLEWYWKCVLRRIFYKLLAVVLSLVSLAVVWSELTFFSKEPTLSLMAIFVNLAKDKHDYLTIEILSILTILYLCVCAYRTVFKVRVFNFYYLADKHHTDEYSLIFSGMMLCRLTPPMCLNFLGLIHMDSHVIKEQVMETHYTQIMGHMDVLPFLSNGFYIYFPMAIAALCAATYFSLGAKFLTFLGFQQFVGDETITSDLVEEGQELVKREKRKQQRPQEGSSTSSFRRIASAPNSARYASLPQADEDPDSPSHGMIRSESEIVLETDDRLLDKMFLGEKTVTYSSTEPRYGEFGKSTYGRKSMFDDV